MDIGVQQAIPVALALLDMLVRGVILDPLVTPEVGDTLAALDILVVVGQLVTLVVLAILDTVGVLEQAMQAVLEMATLDQWVLVMKD